MIYRFGIWHALGYGIFLGFNVALQNDKKKHDAVALRALVWKK